MVFKIDFEKAFESVSWDFIDRILHFLGFGSRWQNWIHGCLYSTKASVLVNGSPSKEFSIQRGLRQGVLLSHFLFILVIEGLNVAIKDAIDANLFHVALIGNLSISRLFFVVDVLLLGEWFHDNVQWIVHLLKCFHNVFCLQINLHKSSLYGVRIPYTNVQTLAAITGRQAHNLPRRLSKWKSNMLSIGGRLTLITSYLGSIGTYYLSMFPMLSQIDKQLESLRSNFFWGSKDNTVKHKWIAWKSVLASKQKGGIDISSLKALNQSFILKWRWRYVHNQNALWVKLINVIHGAYNGGSDLFSPLKCKGTWSKIASSINFLHSNGVVPHHTLTRKVNDGKSTSFWHDFWLDNFSLKDKFPRLYQAVPQQNCLVGDKWNNDWNWIHGCLYSTKASVLVNGSPSKEFSIQRGLRQGVALSPFLFILVMEGLNVAIKDAIDANLFHVALISNLSISHLFFVVDVLLLANMSRVTAWSLIIGKFKQRLSKWKSNMLSIGGRFTLITSDLGSLGTYYLSMFPMPSQIEKQLESLGSNFFWGSKDNTVKHKWIAWKSVFASKQKDGIGIGSLKALNQSLLLKWRWRYVHNQNALWIASSINFLHSNGFAPHHTLTRKVNDAFCRGIILDQFNELFHLSKSVHLSDLPDEWLWDHANSKNFTVKETRLYIDDALLPNHLPDARWCRFIPKKVNILSWRVLRDRLLNRWNISRKGFYIPFLLCPVCSLFPVANFHIFWSCNYCGIIAIISHRLVARMERITINENEIKSEVFDLLKIDLDLFTYDTPLETIFDESKRLSSTEVDLFVYKLGVLEDFYFPCVEQPYDNLKNGNLNIYVP
nr:RNA-directed DNA polymerase, eukaryota, reverse transcriptase zinc-binding domain protein [Tanacetum cinerariifolium]